MLTAVAAAGLVLCETRPDETMRIAANALGTDTDTIATMAGAIVGVTAETDPPAGSVLDEDLFRSDATRLVGMPREASRRVICIRDLMHWSASKSRSDTLVRLDDGGLIVKGPRTGSKDDRQPLSAGKGNFQWQWLKLKTGQTLLIKSRKSSPVRLEEDETASQPRTDSHEANETVSYASSSGKYLPSAKPADDPYQTLTKSPSRISSGPGKSSLRDVLIYVEKHIDSDEKVGAAFKARS